MVVGMDAPQTALLPAAAPAGRAFGAPIFPPWQAIPGTNSVYDYFTCNTLQAMQVPPPRVQRRAVPGASVLVGCETPWLPSEPCPAPAPSSSKPWTSISGAPSA